MPRKKLQKILTVDSLPNVFHERPQEASSWLLDYLPEARSLTIEVGCGRGDYSIRMAQRYPGCNFVGVDVKGARLWTGAKWALREKVTNVAFLRARAEFLHGYFAEGSVDAIWIPFPDPFPKKRQQKSRVISPAFLESYRTILRDGGPVHLKTDDLRFHEYALEVIRRQGLRILACSQDIYADRLDGPVTEIQTRYEEQHLALGKKITYLCFSFE